MYSVWSKIAGFSKIISPPMETKWSVLWAAEWQFKDVSFRCATLLYLIRNDTTITSLFSARELHDRNCEKVCFDFLFYHPSTPQGLQLMTGTRAPQPHWCMWGAKRSLSLSPRRATAAQLPIIYRQNIVKLFYMPVQQLVYFLLC